MIISIPLVTTLLNSFAGSEGEASVVLYFAGSDGWRAWEALSERERAQFGLEQEDPVRFERPRSDAP